MGAALPTTAGVILHIGRQKSGTSSLQHALARGAGALAAHGVLYPAAGRRGVAHHALAGAFLDKVRRGSPDLVAATIDAARREIAAWPGRVVLSSEAFQNVKDPLDLRAVVDPSRCDVVVYLREHYGQAQSSYAQGVHRQRWSMSFAAYLAGFGTSYLGFLMRWRGRFVPRRLHVRPFARDALLNGDIVDDFAALVDLPRHMLATSDVDRNPSIGGPLLEFKRAVNALPALPAVFDRGYNLLSRVAASDPEFRVKPEVQAEEVTAFRDRYAAERQVLVGSYPPLAVLDRPPAAKPVAEFGAADFAAVWRAIDAEDADWGAMLRAALAAAPPGDLVLRRIAEASV